MSDEIDQACEREEFFRDMALRNRRPEHHLVAGGYCHWCDAEVGADERFCHGTECKDEFRRVQEIKRKTGAL